MIVGSLPYARQGYLINNKGNNAELNHAKIFSLKQAIDPQQGLNRH